MTLTDSLAIGRDGSREAVATQGRALDAGELDRQAEGWAAAIAGALPERTACALLVEDPLTFVAAILGVWRAGCAAVPIDPARPPAEAMSAIAHSHALALVTDRSEPELEGQLSERGCKPLRRPGSGTAARPPSEEDTALLIHTSGTTGEPKCVAFSHLAMMRNVDSLIEAAGLTPEDSLFSPLPPSLTTVLASCVLPGLRLGARITLPGRFLPLQTRRLLVERRATVLLGVPYVYHLLAQLPLGDRESGLRLCITNSAPMAPSVATAFEERYGVLPRPNYCSSEAGGITYNAAEDRELLLSSVGTALPGVRVKTVDEDGRPVPPGIEGQVVVESPMAASGYLDRPEATARVFHDGGIWTDDLGVLDAAGYLRITGRISSIVNVAGNLVNPEEVEAVLLRHPSVAEALVVGEEDAGASQTLIAMVVTRGGFDAAALRDLCFRELAPHKVPRRIEAVPALPRDALGKLRRRTRVPA
jgi:acyl-CoA synthetase (AMP-forming)/AMP-acid ligase II